MKEKMLEITLKNNHVKIAKLDDRLDPDYIFPFLEKGLSSYVDQASDLESLFANYNYLTYIYFLAEYLKTTDDLTHFLDLEGYKHISIKLTIEIGEENDSHYKTGTMKVNYPDGFMKLGYAYALSFLLAYATYEDDMLYLHMLTSIIFFSQLKKFFIDEEAYA